MEIRERLKQEGVLLVPAGKQHARMMRTLMCPKGRSEIRASGGFADPEPAVRMSINHSEESWAAYHDGNLVGVFGVQVPTQGQFQIIWAMTTVHAAKHPLVFLRASKAAVECLRDKYPLMVNMVHARWKEALSWVRLLGFEIGPIEGYGPKGEGFCRVMLHTPRVIACAR